MTRHRWLHVCDSNLGIRKFRPYSPGMEDNYFISSGIIFWDDILGRYMTKIRYFFMFNFQFLGPG